MFIEALSVILAFILSLKMAKRLYFHTTSDMETFEVGISVEERIISYILYVTVIEH